MELILNQTDILWV